LFLGGSGLLLACMCAAQGWGWRNRDQYDHAHNGIILTEEGDPVNEYTVQTAREIASHSTGTPDWTNAPGFEKDTWTFTRIIRDRAESGQCSWSAGAWITDFPDSDLNLSFRVQQMTTIKVDPNGRTIRLTDPDLYNYPWIYTVEPGGLLLRNEEVPILKKYLLNGGVLMVDDFWGEWQWKFFAQQMKRVFPDRDFVDLDMSDPIFHCVFDLNVPMNKLQTPNSHQGIRSQYDGVTWETHGREGYPDRWGPHSEQCINMHVRVLRDDKGHIMVIAMHDCDNGDGWEREGENDYFFHEFSEKRAFPLGINILFYLMTH
jgi:hypothetical protein